MAPTADELETAAAALRESNPGNRAAKRVPQRPAVHFGLPFHACAARA